MKWRTNAKEGRFDASAGPFRLEVVEERFGFSWKVWLQKTCIVWGNNDFAEVARVNAEEYVFNLAIDTLKGFRG